jgi:LysM repeat protein
LSIVECKYVNGDWFPIKNRPDKLNPNYVDIAKDVLETITNPFDLESLKGLVKAPVPLVNMRRFHNYIKRIYIEKLVGENKNVYLLDLASGNGGDFGKYSDNSVKYVEAYDIDSDSVEESKRRVETMKTKTKRVLVLTEYNIKQADLNKTELKTGKQFDIIVCNFALHYFYRNIVKFINNIDKNSKVGTKLMFSFFDGKLVVPLDTESFSLKKVNDKEIEVFLKGSVLNTPTKEYVVKRGDTFNSIVRKYKLNADKLKQINNIKNENTIQVGQKLKLM